MRTSAQILGLMAGSSMDGLDAALCVFHPQKINGISYSIIKQRTFPYPPHILKLLQNIRRTSSYEYFEADVQYAQWIGTTIQQWIKRHRLKVDALAVHGHTVFHHPEKGFSIQLGNAAQIAAITSIPVIHNFRNLDIAQGGQGAPLVPIGDKILFSEYDACVNIGGIANVFVHKKEWAYDVCIANIALNFFAQKLKMPFDKEGTLAKHGKVHTAMLRALNELPFFQMSPPKSLNREYFERYYLPVIQTYKAPIPDILSTLTEHIARHIAQSVQYPFVRNILMTGGGVLNKYLMKRIIYYAPTKNFVIPHHKILIKYKEALVFALMGYLRLNQLPNTLSKTTGAKMNVSCGDIVHI